MKIQFHFINSLLAVLLLAEPSNAAVSFHQLQEDFESSGANVVDRSNKKTGLTTNSLPVPQGFPVQNQKTNTCPTAVENLYAGHVKLGHRTRFVVKNTATAPVAIAFVERDGSERSAANYDIVPANADPDAVLAPGVTKVFAVQEGHVFHVRDTTTGELLMQHRAGLVPIQNKFNQALECDGVENQKDDAVMDNSSYRVMRKFPGWKPIAMDPYKQEIGTDVGFRNEVISSSGKVCPLNFYFVKKHRKAESSKPNYLERFSFRLGNDHQLVGDQVWNAATRHERTYFGHEFSIRLASDDNVVVDHVAIQPEKVIDCSNRKREATKAASRASGAIVIPVRRIDSSAVGNNRTELDHFVNRQNTTETGRSFYFKMLSE